MKKKINKGKTGSGKPPTVVKSVIFVESFENALAEINKSPNKEPTVAERLKPSVAKLSTIFTKNKI